MALTLEDMTEEEFEAFRVMSVQNFAKQNITSGTWTEKEAFEKSEQAYENMIPNGRDSSNHYFWNITNDQGERMGWLWLYADPLHPQKERLSIPLDCMKPFAEKDLLNWRFKRLMKEQESLVRKGWLYMYLHTTRQPSIFIRRWAMP
ncbi:hypothetical protein ACVW0X_000643 [Bacillus subtilis]